MNRKDVLQMINNNEITVDEGLRLFDILEEEKEENIHKENNSFKQAMDNLDKKMKEINSKFIKPNVNKGYKALKKGFNKLNKQIVKLIGEDF